MLTPKGAGIIRGRHLLETRRLLEEIRYMKNISKKKVPLPGILCKLKRVYCTINKEDLINIIEGLVCIRTLKVKGNGLRLNYHYKCYNFKQMVMLQAVVSLLVVTVMQLCQKSILYVIFQIEIIWFVFHTNDNRFFVISLLKPPLFS